YIHTPPPTPTLFPYTTLFRSLARLGRRDDEAALSLSDGRDDVDDAAGDVFLALHVALELEALVRVQRREVLEQDLVLRSFGRVRSEEHTSELQSLRHLVCRLL